MRWVRGATAIILVLALTAGCGASSGDGVSSEKDESAATSTTALAAGEGAAASTGSKGSKSAKEMSASTTTSPPAGSGAAAVVGEKEGAGAMQSQGGTSEPDGSELPSEPLPLEVELSSRCVRPGTPLTVTVRTAPKAHVGYDTTWADGKTGWDSANRGGMAKGTADDAGIWRNTGPIGTDAPKGTAKVDVIGADVTGRMGRKTVEYQVSDALGKCA